MNILLSTYNAQNIYFFVVEELGFFVVVFFLETNKVPVKCIFRADLAKQGKYKCQKYRLSKCIERPNTLSS